HAVGEEHGALRAELAGLEERLRSEKATAARLEAQIRQIQMRREELVRDLERMGVERARLLADNVELDRRAAEISGELADASASVERLAAAETEGRAALAALDESLKALRLEAQAAQERRASIE